MACQDGKYVPVGHENRPTCSGFLSGREVTVLRDTGCDTAAVRTSLVKEHEFTGTVETCLLIDGTERKFRLAKVNVDTPFFTGEVTALCMRNPIYGLIVGNIPGARQPDDPDPAWMPVKHTGINNDDSLKDVCVKTEGTMDTHDLNSNVEQPLTSAVETRNMKQKQRNPMSPLKVASPISQALKNFWWHSKMMKASLICGKRPSILVMGSTSLR